MRFKGDFHIHSCLSPCAHIAMTPHEIAKALKSAGVEWTSITDHNSCGNVEVFEKVLAAYDISLIPGVEVETKEEVHVLVYLRDVQTAQAFSRELEEYLPPVANDPEKFGYQLFVNEKDEFVAMEDKMLAMATTLSIDELWEMTNRYEGLFVYAHIFRKFGIMTQLGFLPDNPSYDALECSNPPEELKRKTAFLKASDAHFLNQIIKAQVEIEAEKRDFENFKRALKRKEVKIL